METFPLSQAHYDRLDDYVMKKLQSTSFSNSTFSTWELYEEDITPPSYIIRKNKLSLFAKLSSKGNTSLAALVLKSTPDNFLRKEALDLSEQWTVNLQLLTELKTKTKRRASLKPAIASAIEADLADLLEDTPWKRAGPWPKLPDAVNSTNKEPTGFIKQLRARWLFQDKNLAMTKCQLCDKQLLNQLEHEAFVCQHPLRLLRRESMVALLNTIEDKLGDHILSLKHDLAMAILLGLVMLQANEKPVYITGTSLEVFKDWKNAVEWHNAHSALLASAMGVLDF